LIVQERAELKLTLLDGGRVRLDGGAMFGVVPKPLWERRRPADERNRIELAMNCLLIEDGARRVLVDNGAGDKWDEKSRDIYGLQPKNAEALLAPAGIVPEDIDVVVLTHLHFDHAGGSTVRHGDGLRPAFPNARYVVQRGELALARLDNERIRASYLAENFEPLAEEEDRLQIVDGDTFLFPWLELRLVPGHTPFMQMVLVRDGAGTVAFPADLVPTASHVPYPWIMGYDLEPLATLETKKRVFPEAVREDWTVLFEHDAELPWGMLRQDGARLTAVATEP